MKKQFLKQLKALILIGTIILAPVIASDVDLQPVARKATIWRLAAIAATAGSGTAGSI